MSLSLFMLFWACAWVMSLALLSKGKYKTITLADVLIQAAIGPVIWMFAILWFSNDIVVWRRK